MQLSLSPRTLLQSSPPDMSFYRHRKALPGGQTTAAGGLGHTKSQKTLAVRDKVVKTGVDEAYSEKVTRMTDSPRKDSGKPTVLRQYNKMEKIGETLSPGLPKRTLISSHNTSSMKSFKERIGVSGAGKQTVPTTSQSRSGGSKVTLDDVKVTAESSSKQRPEKLNLNLQDSDHNAFKQVFPGFKPPMPMGIVSETDIKPNSPPKEESPKHKTNICIYSLPMNNHAVVKSLENDSIKNNMTLDQSSLIQLPMLPHPLTESLPAIPSGYGAYLQDALDLQSILRTGETAASLDKQHPKHPTIKMKGNPTKFCIQSSLNDAASLKKRSQAQKKVYRSKADFSVGLKRTGTLENFDEYLNTKGHGSIRQNPSAVGLNNFKRLFQDQFRKAVNKCFSPSKTTRSLSRVFILNQNTLELEGAVDEGSSRHPDKSLPKQHRDDRKRSSEIAKFNSINKMINFVENDSALVKGRKVLLDDMKKFRSAFVNEINETPVKDESIAHLRFKRTLGGGKFATVKMAEDERTGRTVAVKIYQKLKIMSKTRFSYFQSEVDNLKRLNHPNIAKLVEVIEGRDHYYIIMELACKITLAHIMRSLSDCALSEDFARTVFRQVLEGLEHCHSLDIIHRDVKVDNIGIDLEGGIESLKLFTHFAHKEQLDPSSLSVQPHSRDEASSSQDPELKSKQSQVLGSVQARLIDFGMSLRLDQHSNIIIEGSTANYKSPEVCKRIPHNGRSSDLWSTAVCLYYTVAGGYPFKGVNEKDLEGKIVKGLSSAPRFLSPELKDLLSKMLSLRKRISSPTEVLQHPWFKNEQLQKVLLAPLKK